MSNLDLQTPISRSQEKSNVSLSASEEWRNAAIENAQSARQNSEISLSFPADQQQDSGSFFRSTNIAPSSPPGAYNAYALPENDKPLHRLDTSSRFLPIETNHSTPSPSSAGLRIQTDIIPGYTITAASTDNTARGSSESARIPIKISSTSLGRTPSIKNVFASSIGSNSNFGSAPNSALSSPMLNALSDVTPLPSPLLTGDSPGPWKKLTARPQSRDLTVPSTADSALVTTNGESISAAAANQSKRRAYHGLSTDSGLISAQNKEKMAEGHPRNRSISEYVPESVQMPKSRHITVSGSHAMVLDVTPTEPVADTHMRREPNLAVQRGLAPIFPPPTPPLSRTGGESSDSDSSLTTANLPRPQRKPHYEYFDAYTRKDKKRRRWRALKILGQGTFSKVMLATSQLPAVEHLKDEEDVFPASQLDGIKTPVSETKIDRKKLVAIKICEHGPKGGASEERVEMSLKRELEIMKSISHPSLVHLKAWSIEETRAILVLSYCSGGDLFGVASECPDLLVPGLLRRMFSEIVAAVQYLHDRHIVHRDIKLENVLVNLPQHELRKKDQNWATYPNSIITLTDLGLSRRVADDEKLTTRCGSDDYAAPEVIMGQPYDGRATDAWSLGVLLYALLESRLPFDPNPGMSEGHKQRSRTSHRIARVEWRWIKYAGDEGDHEGDPEKFKEQGLLGAMNVAEGLLRRARTRWTMARVAEEEWVKGGVDLEHGIRFREEDTPDEVPDNGIQSPL
ncbi:related to rat SNF1, Celegans unc-51, Dun1p and other protein serine kinases [Rhynchosporium graminicola]|uniref:Related to rat SNF1, Celegans unc-51, Dun1p and other protein serine kinases n=1 Tax=Rhynchosporium graminicola TaxID=2792576 RepID=A0A1E1L8G5_9HELO|nr:related to rat SNF1, Celegans unc-51, Dun1p and other protein serine kinases [Rhynchosporium commune]